MKLTTIFFVLLVASITAAQVTRPTAQRPAIPTIPAASTAPLWQLRSEHFVYGMPECTDDRHQIAQKDGSIAAGISVLVREGFVVGHYDKMKVPAWVMTRWTEEEYRASETEPYNERDFEPDHELPLYARAEKNYDFKTSKMQRGHMARQQDNKAWGADNVEMGCRMSNIVPQKDTMNGAAWGDIEDEHRTVVANGAKRIKAVWVISGPVFRKSVADKEDTVLMKVGNDIGVPYATYKVIGWFDAGGKFQERAFLVRQEDTKKGPKNYLTTVDEIEALTGLDFFRDLPDQLENKLEAEKHTELWN